MADHDITGDSLVDLLDRLIETGVAATGDLVLGLADVDLVRVSLQLVLGSVDELGDGTRPAGPPQADSPRPAAVTGGRAPGFPQPSAPGAQQPSAPGAQQPSAPGAQQPSAPGAQQRQSRGQPPARQPAAEVELPDLGDANRGIGGLLVAVVELVRQLLERQAIHRMERGTLTPDQVERLGRALQDLDRRVGQLIEVFGTSPAGPLLSAAG